MRTFEVVARYNSFSRAAEELAVSPSAVSQQIKLLEEHLGVCLFERQPKSLTLTENGMQLYPAVAQAFALLTDAAQLVSGQPGAISISTTASFAMSWLMPRFRAFEEQHADVNVFLNAAPQVSGPNALSIYDVEVEYVDEAQESSDQQRPLLNEWLLPVCAPGYAKGHTLCISELGAYRLLLNDPGADDWKAWLKHHNVSARQAKDYLRKAIPLPTDASAIEMAVGGLGIAMANVHYVVGKLERGLLVPALNVDAFQLGQHRINLHQFHTRGAAYKLIRWLSDEAQASQNAINGWLIASQRPHINDKQP